MQLVRLCIGFIMAILLQDAARAVPIFARQTGQRCATCHAGGQFPELTPFGRQFKLGGYTLGQGTSPPLAVMGIASYTSTRNTNSDHPDADFPKNAVALFQTASLFAGGRITDHLGLFAQVTYDNYAAQDPLTLRWIGHSHVDNIDLRYAAHLANEASDWIIGASLNNNPSVSDLWNTAPAWIEYVPTSFGFTGPASAPIVAQLGQQVAGITAYASWKQRLYAEFGLYRAATGGFSFLVSGNDIENRLRGTAPYLRLAASHDGGAHNAMIGLVGMNARVYADPAMPGGPATTYRDRGIDAQYQYLRDPHTLTGQASYIRERISGGDLGGVTTQPEVSLRQWRLKASYIYQARYGLGLSYFSTSGTSDDTLYPGLQDDGTGGGTLVPIPVGGSAQHNPDTRGWLPEVFWTPWQHMRIGARYTRFTRYNGAKNNYDGAFRNAGDNDTLFIYAWIVY